VVKRLTASQELSFVELVIIIIIMTGKTAPFEAEPSLEGPAILHPDFISLDSETIFIFLQHKVVSFVSNPQPGGPGPCIYVPQ
jgi:hypothetical protein